MPEGNPVRPAVNPVTNIPIPDDVFIEEQYADILKVIDSILPYFDDYELDNHKPEGRLKGELLYIKQEVKTKRLSVPNDTRTISTIYSLAGEPMFPKGFPDIKKELYSIAAAVTCKGLIKPRHYPRMIELIDNNINAATIILHTDKSTTLEEKKNIRELIFELKEIAFLLYNNKHILPLDTAKWPAYFNTKSRRPVLNRHKTFYDADNALSGPFSSNWRPRQSQPTPGWEMPDWVKNPMGNTDGD